jgi:glycosyltransferase involved in cell wall biosynthesis
MDPEISVVIPTFNRKETLALCLQALEEQDAPAGRAEVVVVDDGSTDGTAEFLEEAAGRAPGRLRFVRQPNSGPAAARNAGTALARAPLVLLLDDDVLAEPGLVREHLAWHRLHPDPMSAVLGYVRWSPRVEVTPFMRFIDENGMQFGYERIRDGERVGFRYFYTCNLSIKRGALLRHPFHTEIRAAAFEDIGLGYRLEREGLALYFHRAAAAHHYRTVGFDEFRGRMRRAGASLRILHQAHPELRDVLRAPRRHRVKRATRRLASLTAPILPPARAEAVLRAYWRAALVDEMARGYRRPA